MKLSIRVIQVINNIGKLLIMLAEKGYTGNIEIRFKDGKPYENIKKEEFVKI